MGKGIKKIGRTEKKSVINAAGRNQSPVGGRPSYDDSLIINSVAMLIAENNWLRKHDPQVPKLDTTNAIRRAVEQTYDVWQTDSNGNDTIKADAVQKSVERIERKLKRALPNGQTMLDDAIELAAKQKTIFGTPITQTLLSTPLPPVMQADTALIYEFRTAVDDLVEWRKVLSKATYTVLDNKTRAELKSFLGCLRKIKR